MSANFRNEIITLKCECHKGAPPKALKVSTDIGVAWLPHSLLKRVEWQQGTVWEIDLPYWLAYDKGLI